MRNSCIWLTASIVLVSLGWYADQASSACAVSCTHTERLQKKVGETAQCLYYNHYYGEIYHPYSAATCNSNPVTYDMRPCSCSSLCDDEWGGAELRAASGSGGPNGDPVDVDGCQTCYGGD